MNTTITRGDGRIFHGPDIMLGRFDLLDGDTLWCCRGIGYLLAVFRDRGGSDPGGTLVGFIPTDELVPAFRSAKDFLRKFGSVARYPFVEPESEDDEWPDGSIGPGSGTNL